MKKGKKKRKKESTKKMKQVKEMIQASATMLRNVHANCGTEGLLTHCTGRPRASQTPCRHPSSHPAVMPHVFGNRDHMAGLSLGFLGETKGQPLVSLPTPLTAAPQLPPRLWELPRCLPKGPLRRSPAREAATWPLTIRRCVAARATDG